MCLRMLLQLRAAGRLSSRMSPARLWCLAGALLKGLVWHMQAFLHLDPGERHFSGSFARMLALQEQAVNDIVAAALTSIKEEFDISVPLWRVVESAALRGNQYVHLLSFLGHHGQQLCCHFCGGAAGSISSCIICAWVPASGADALRVRHVMFFGTGLLEQASSGIFSRLW